MYTIKEVSEILKLHYDTVRKKIKAGQIKAVHIGGTIRITEEEVERLKRGE